MKKRPIVSVDWLEARLADNKVADNNVCVVDGSWHLPPENRDAASEYLQGHIPGAVFFDIDSVSTTGDLPHMMPTAAFFAECVGNLGIEKSNTVVVYDTKGLFSAARVWWMFSVFGFNDVRILDGGMPAWTEAGYGLESGAVEVVSVAVDATAPKVHSVVDAAQVLDASNNQSAQILDARSQGRFDGVDPEPRAGLRSGHIPGSICLPYTLLLDNGKLKPNAELREIFTQHGVASETAIYTTCGSGVTAAILTLGLECIGHGDSSLYDGSWTEWGGREELPVDRKET